MKLQSIKIQITIWWHKPLPSRNPPSIRWRGYTLTLHKYKHHNSYQNIQVLQILAKLFGKNPPFLKWTIKISPLVIKKRVMELKSAFKYQSMNKGFSFISILTESAVSSTSSYSIITNLHPSVCYLRLGKKHDFIGP